MQFCNNLVEYFNFIVFSSSYLCYTHISNYLVFQYDYDVVHRKVISCLLTLVSLVRVYSEKTRNFEQSDHSFCCIAALVQLILLELLPIVSYELFTRFYDYQD